MVKEKIFKMSFSNVYPLYVKKVERKGRSKEKVDEAIYWLTSYSEEKFKEQLEKEVDFETFFAEAPEINENISLIKGTICGVRIEDIEDELMYKIRCLDKLVDEIAKGKTMEKILR